MEEDVFLRPAVAGLLKKHFVEARVHVDIKSTLTDAQVANNKKRQAELVNTTAMPTFTVVDPETGEQLGTHQLGTSPAGYEPRFITFLQEVLQ